MSRRSRAADRRADALRRAEALRVSIRQRSAGAGAIGLALIGISRLTAGDGVPVFVILTGVGFAVFLWVRRGWMREYREVLSAAGVDPERDQLVEDGASARSLFLILGGMFGGFVLFLAVVMWLAGR